MIENKVVLKYIRMSPRKVRLVCDQLRGLDFLDAMDVLRYSNKKSVEPLMKLFNSCMANLYNINEQKGSDSYYVKKLLVDEGPTMKRFRPRARGRASKIKKRMSQVTLVLSESENKSGSL